MSNTSQHEKAVHQFLRTGVRAIVRAEANGRIPQRFNGTGREIWQTFRNELTTADLVALAVQDAGATMPVPFNPTVWWPDWPDWALRDLPDEQAQRWVAAAKESTQQSQPDYLQTQAAELGLNLLAKEVVSSLPTPAAHERWLELPGTAGWIAYALCTRSEADLYFWENFTILCQSPQEMLFAGLLAWELNAPPGQALPIYLDPELTDTLHGEQTYHQLVARRDLHGHRALTFLHNSGSEPLWIG
jgi:hypothetical protein